MGRSKQKASRSKRSRGKSRASNGKPTAPAPKPPAVDALEAKAAQSGIKVEAPREPTRTARLDSLIEAYERARGEADARAAALEGERAALQSDRDTVELDRDANAETKRQLDERGESLAHLRREMDATRQNLSERTEAIIAREADADASFVSRREEMLREVSAAHERLLADIRQLHERAAEREQQHAERLVDERANHATKLAELRAKFETELAQRRREAAEELKGRQDAAVQALTKANERERLTARARFDAQEAERDALDLKAHVEEHIETRVAARVEQTMRELEDARRDQDALRARAAELERELAAREDAGRALEHGSPQAIKRRIEALKARVDTLNDELADRPSRAEADELAALREQKTGWEQERRTLLAEKGRLESRLERLQIEVDAVENLRDRNTALLEGQRLLGAALDDLRAEVDERLEKRQDKPVFGALNDVDEDPKLQQPPASLYRGDDDKGIDLRRFADDLRHRLGFGVGERPDLYYRVEDVRAFLGGLAMSRLHLLQGISGIGKSSLPRAFADAVGGLCETVSVQAGWRDRNDLLGYFNVFEQRYYTQPFVQAVYKAGTELWQGRIVIVLLDEMNLSHPEQYAADLLDVLARTEPSRRRFDLVPSTPNGKTPVRLVDGRRLLLPDNVWFVGTANHDETTRDFAPKTYDRSFVLELPGQPKPFKPDKPPRRAPVSHRALIDAFAAAEKKYARKADDALRWMDEHLRAPMSRNFGVGWGGRLQGQIARYVPAVIAAGGSLGEALDQIVTSRVLRKIKGRHDNVEEHLVSLGDMIESDWPDGDGASTAARALVADELRGLVG